GKHSPGNLMLLIFRPSTALALTRSAQDETMLSYLPCQSPRCEKLFRASVRPHPPNKQSQDKLSQPRDKSQLDHTSVRRWISLLPSIRGRRSETQLLLISVRRQ